MRPAVFNTGLEEALNLVGTFICAIVALQRCLN